MPNSNKSTILLLALAAVSAKQAAAALGSSPSNLRGNQDGLTKVFGIETNLEKANSGLRYRGTSDTVSKHLDETDKDESKLMPFYTDAGDDETDDFEIETVFKTLYNDPETFETVVSTPATIATPTTANRNPPKENINPEEGSSTTKKESKYSRRQLKKKKRSEEANPPPLSPLETTDPVDNKGETAENDLPLDNEIPIIHQASSLPEDVDSIIAVNEEVPLHNKGSVLVKPNIQEKNVNTEYLGPQMGNNHKYHNPNMDKNIAVNKEAPLHAKDSLLVKPSFHEKNANIGYLGPHLGKTHKYHNPNLDKDNNVRIKATVLDKKVIRNNLDPRMGKSNQQEPRLPIKDADALPVNKKTPRYNEDNGRVKTTLGDFDKAIQMNGFGSSNESLQIQYSLESHTEPTKSSSLPSSLPSSPERFRAGVGCPGDIKLLRQEGDKSVLASDPIHDAVEITHQDTTTVTVDLYQVWENKAGYPMESFYYHYYKQGEDDDQCFEKTGVPFSASEPLDTIEIACYVDQPYAELEICLVDDVGHGSLMPEDDFSLSLPAMIPRVCNHEGVVDNSPTKVSACYVLEINCLPPTEENSSC